MTGPADIGLSAACCDPVLEQSAGDDLSSYCFGHEAEAADFIATEAAHFFVCFAIGIMAWFLSTCVLAIDIAEESVSMKPVILIVTQHLPEYGSAQQCASSTISGAFSISPAFTACVQGCLRGAQQPPLMASATRRFDRQAALGGFAGPATTGA